MILCRAINRSGGLGLCLTCNWPIQDRVGDFPTCNRPMYNNRCINSSCRWVVVSFGWNQKSPEFTETWQDLARFAEDPPRFSLNLLDPARFLPNHVEKSLVWPNLVYIMLEITKLVENLAKSLEKMAEVNGLWMGRDSRVLEEEIWNQPSNAGFLTSRLESERRIEWFWVGFGRVG